MIDKHEPARRLGLRVGILHGERLVEERVVAASAVTLGAGAGDTFIVPPDEAGSRSRVLFSRTAHGYALHVAPPLDGRLSPGRGRPVSSLAELAAHAADRRVALDEGSRGSLALGEIRVLFQVVALPDALRPALPPSLRRGLAGNLDWAMLAVVAVSLFSHVGFVAWLRQLDYPRRPSIEEIPERFPYALLTQPINVKLAEKVPIEQAPAPPVPTVPTHEPRVHRTTTPPSAEALAAAARERARRATERVHQVVAGILTARGDGGNLITDLLSAGAPSEDADDVFARVGTTIGTGGRALLGPRDGGGGGHLRGGTSIRAGVVEELPALAKRERDVKVPEPRLPGGAEITLDSGCDPDRIAAAIRQRRGAFTACYSKVLPHDPSLAGKVILMLDLTSSGRVRHAEIHDETLRSPDLDTCIEQSASHWVFPDLGCGESHVEFPLFFTPPHQ